MSTHDYERILRRSLLPQVLFDGDIAVALGISRPAAASGLGRGVYGRVLTVGVKQAVLREDFLDALAQQATPLEVPDAPP